MLELTKRQKGVLRMIRTHINRTGLPPTRSDICKHFGFRSPTSADTHLRGLESKGAIKLIPGISRGMRLVSRSPETGIPVISKAVAGEPINSNANIGEYLPVDPDSFTPHADYMLTVQGDSMRNAGIYDGDMVAVHATDDIQKDQIVVVRINDEVLIRRFRSRGSIVTLTSENDDFVPIRVDLREEEFYIEGVYVGVLRREQPMQACTV